MSENKILLLSIVREPVFPPIFNFIFFDKQIKILPVTTSLYKNILSGTYYIGDTLQINDGPEIHTIQHLEDDDTLLDLFYKENNLKKIPQYFEILALMNLNKRYLPFLNDCPIIAKKEISVIGLEIENSIFCKVVLKSRLNYKPPSTFFFHIIVESAGEFFKVNFWDKASKLHATIKINQELILKDVKLVNKKQLTNLTYNTFYEGDTFGFKEYKVNLENVFIYEPLIFESADSKENFEVKIKKIRMNCNLPQNDLSIRLEGVITYLSVINRERTKWQDYLTVESNVFEYFLLRIGTKMVILYCNSEQEFYSLGVGKFVILQNMRLYERGGEKLFISTIYTTIQIKSDMINDSVLYGLGFIPDNFETFLQSQEINTKRIENSFITINPIFRPEKLELFPDFSTFLINESRKYFFQDVFVKPIDEKLSYEFIKNGKYIKEEGECVLLIKDEVQKMVYNFYNYFTEEKKVVKEGRASVIVNCFKSDNKGLLMVISQVFYE